MYSKYPALEKIKTVEALKDNLNNNATVKYTVIGNDKCYQDVTQIKHAQIIHVPVVALFDQNKKLCKVAIPAKDEYGDKVKAALDKFKENVSHLNSRSGDSPAMSFDDVFGAEQTVLENFTITYRKGMITSNGTGTFKEIVTDGDVLKMKITPASTSTSETEIELSNILTIAPPTNNYQGLKQVTLNDLTNFDLDDLVLEKNSGNNYTVYRITGTALTTTNKLNLKSLSGAKKILTDNNIRSFYYFKQDSSSGSSGSSGSPGSPPAPPPPTLLKWNDVKNNLLNINHDPNTALKYFSTTLNQHDTELMDLSISNDQYTYKNTENTVTNVASDEISKIDGLAEEQFPGVDIPNGALPGQILSVGHLITFNVDPNANNENWVFARVTTFNIGDDNIGITLNVKDSNNNYIVYNVSTSSKEDPAGADGTAQKPYGYGRIRIPQFTITISGGSKNKQRNTRRNNQKTKRRQKNQNRKTNRKNYNRRTRKF